MDAAAAADTTITSIVVGGLGAPKKPNPKHTPIDALYVVCVDPAYSQDAAIDLPNVWQPDGPDCLH